eukprot:scaffold23465_cov63-Phaeocystis_antarctica.AAC.4
MRGRKRLIVAPPACGLAQTMCPSMCVKCKPIRCVDILKAFNVSPTIVKISPFHRLPNSYPLPDTPPQKGDYGKNVKSFR